MPFERTLLIVKPDGVSRGLVGEVLSRVERKGFKIERMKLMNVDGELAQKHYAEHVNEPFFERLVSFITGGPVVAVVLSGNGCITALREIMGATDPAEAMPGTIRGDFATEMPANLVHGSDSPASAEREISLFFGDGGEMTGAG